MKKIGSLVMIGHPGGKPTKILPLYWFAKRRYVVLQVGVNDGTARMFPLFTDEDKAYAYQAAQQEAGTFGPDWTLWTTDYAEFIFDVLEKTKEGFDIYVLDPPPEAEVPAVWHDLNRVKAEILALRSEAQEPQNN